MKKIILIYTFWGLPFLSFGQIGIHFKSGPSMLSRGDFKGFLYEVGISKEIARNFDLELDFSANQYNKTQEFYYELVPGGIKDQIATFKHINYVNQLKLNGKYYFLKKKIKFSLSGGGSYFNINSSTPRSFTVLYPLLTGFQTPAFIINYYELGFKERGIGQNINFNIEYHIHKKGTIGLSLNFTNYHGIFIWDVPLSYKIN